MGLWGKFIWTETGRIIYNESECCSSAMRFSIGYAVSTVRLRFFPFQPLRTTLPAAASLRGPGHSQKTLYEFFAQVTLENPGLYPGFSTRSSRHLRASSSRAPSKGSFGIRTPSASLTPHARSHKVLLEPAGK